MIADDVPTARRANCDIIDRAEDVGPEFVITHAGSVYTEREPNNPMVVAASRSA